MSELHRPKKAGAILDVPNFGEGHEPFRCLTD